MRNNSAVRTSTLLQRLKSYLNLVKPIRVIAQRGGEGAIVGCQKQTRLSGMGHLSPIMSGQTRNRMISSSAKVRQGSLGAQLGTSDPMPSLDLSLRPLLVQFQDGTNVGTDRRSESQVMGGDCTEQGCSQPL